MTRLHTHVYLDRWTGRWVAEVEEIPEIDLPCYLGSSWTTFSPSWAEAMQAGEAMRALLDRLLLDQVQAERMQRRYGDRPPRPERRVERCDVCGDTLQPGTAHAILSPITCTNDIHTLEATA